MDITSQKINLTFKEMGIVDIMPLYNIENSLMKEIDTLDDISFFDNTMTLDPNESNCFELWREIKLIRESITKHVLAHKNNPEYNHTEKDLKLINESLELINV
jgi:hypothetical protein